MAHQEPQTRCPIDVFLSFRGEDTRHSFTGTLHKELTRKGVNTFMDDKGLKIGDFISHALLNAIRQSRISIVVFSQNYAHSSWCLDELVEIVDCMKSRNQLVWPIFYKVDPSHVRHQNNSYFEAMAKHEKRFPEKVQRWKSALSEVASLSGRHYQTGFECKFIQEIVENATAQLKSKKLDVGDEHIIGHQSRIEEVMLLLDIESKKTVCMLGIHGTGGMGKTTLVMALCSSIIHRFECAVFLEDIRERSNSHEGLVHLQEAILSKLFEGENIKLGGVREGVTRLKDILQDKRVLLVLDDVDSEDQLENLAGNCDWFGPGSRIIITTRDKHILHLHGVEKRYEMKGLNDHEAFQLFCSKAFKKSHPPMNYEDVSARVVKYVGGLPLALKVIGSNLAGKSVEICESRLQQYERIPPGKIHNILRISYDCLEEYDQKVFLDIACFFKGKSLTYVKEVLEEPNFSPISNIDTLVDKSLLSIENGCLRMHDLIQDMGREVVRQEAPRKPGDRSRLYYHEDVLKVLREDLGSSNIKGILLDPPKDVEVEWSGTAFEKMSYIRILIIRNTHFTRESSYLPNSLKVLEWDRCPLKSLPPDLGNIVDLSLPCSHLRFKRGMSFQKMMHVTYMNFSRCQFITHFPDVSGVSSLRTLDLSDCRNLVAVHNSVGFLKKLEMLDARDCSKLKVFLPKMWLPSLQHLDLRDTKIESFPHIEEKMCEELYIWLKRCPIKELPDSISNLMGLKFIDMEAKSLTPGGLPSDLFMLPNIFQLCLEGCSPEVGESFRRLLNSLVLATTRYSPLRILLCESCGLTDEDLHAILCCFPNLIRLEVPQNDFVSLPECIKEFANLQDLDVCGCKNLKEIPELPSSLKKVEAADCWSLSLEACRMLWYQASKEVRQLKVVMPRRAEIPSWFDHQCEGRVVSFWARRKFPVFALAFMMEKCVNEISIGLNINGSDIAECFGRQIYFNISYGYEPVVFLIDLQSQYTFEGEILDTYLVSSEWKYVQVQVATYDDDDDDETPIPISKWGAYVYRKQTNMEDIRFTPPGDHSQNKKKRTKSIVDDDGITPKRRKMMKAKSRGKGLLMGGTPNVEDVFSWRA